jgi:hypothetical protein
MNLFVFLLRFSMTNVFADSSQLESPITFTFPSPEFVPIPSTCYPITSRHSTPPTTCSNFQLSFPITSPAPPHLLVLTAIPTPQKLPVQHADKYILNAPSSLPFLSNIQHLPIRARAYIPVSGWSLSLAVEGRRRSG